MSRGRHWTPHTLKSVVPVALATAVLVLGAGLPAWGARTADPTDPSIRNAPITFSVTGDAPYGDDEVPEVQQQFDDHNLYSPSSFLVHVGDIFAGSDACSEFRYQRMADQLRTLAVPAFIVPGDNETVDCVDPNRGWQYWEAHLLGIENDFCGVPDVERQSGREENFAFVQSGVLFIGIHLVGGSNSAAVLQDDADWAEQQLQSKASFVRAAVLFAQEGPEAGTTFWNQFETDVAAFGKPVLVVHGDGHSWIHDNPFSQPNMTRVQIDRGDAPPVHITVNTDTQNPFQFDRDPWPTGTPTLNTPVCVDAGPNKSIPGPGTIVLEGLVKDDGLVNGSASPAWSAIDPPATVTFGDASSPTSMVTFDASGTYVLQLSADDGEYADWDNVSVFVGDQPNVAPLARDDAYQIDEDVTLSKGAPGLLANDEDDDGDDLTASVETGPSHGSVSLLANGSFYYTPAVNYFGSDSFSYRVSDGRGGLDTGNVSITIVPVNDPPLTVADHYSTGYIEPLTVDSGGVLANDSDVEGDPFTARLHSEPQNGMLLFEPDGSFSYVPNAGFAGWDSFTYIASDGDDSAPTTVTIAVSLSIFEPTEDATVRANQFRKNFGTQSTLEIRGTNKPYHSYLKFDVRGIESVRAATLRLHVNGSVSDAGEVHVASNDYVTSDTTWDEHGITWNNAPGVTGAIVATGAAASTGTWVEFDVTDVIQNGVTSFGLRNNSTTTVTFSSKEGAYAPQLVVAWVPRAAARRYPNQIAPSGPSDPMQPADKSILAETNALERVFPNPTRSGAWIEYRLAHAARVQMRIFNARGQRVRTLRSAASGSGMQRVFWDGRDDRGRTLSSGIYFLQLDLGPRRYIRKILIER